MPRTYDRTEYVELCKGPDGTGPEAGTGDCAYDETDQRCFSCNVRSMRVQPDAMPSRRNNVPPSVSPSANAVERGVLTDERGVPIRENGKVIGLKQYRDNKRAYDEKIRQARTPVASPPASP